MNENITQQYLPGDPRLVDQLVYELKSKGIFDQFRKECIADVDTRPAYQNLRQRVETSVATFLSRQVWKPDLNKNQLREKLRKHLLDGNYLEQGVERIVDQVVNPKVASVFIPQVEDVVYNYLGIPRKKKVETETSEKSENDLLPTDLEAVSPGSVKSNDDKSEAMDTSESQEENRMEIVDDKPELDIKEDSVTFVEVVDKDKTEENSRMSMGSEIICQDSNISIDKSNIPLPEEIKLENIPEPENSPPKIDIKDIDLEKIDLPKEPNPSTDIPLPDEMPKIEETFYMKETIISTVISTDIPLPDEMPRIEKGDYFKPIILHSEDDDSSSDSSLRRNMSPLTPIRNFNNENTCDAQQAFDNDSDGKSNDVKEPCSFRFTIESKSSDNSCEAKPEKNDEHALSYQFNNQVNINSYNTPLYEDSSNSNNLQIDYESDANSKATTATEIKAPETDNSVDLKKEKKSDDRKSSSHKSSSSRSRDSHRHSSSKGKRADSKQSSRDSSRHDKKPSSSSKDDKSKSNKDKEKPSDKSDKKDSRESSKHKSSSSHKSSSHSNHKESSSGHRDSSSKHRSSSSRHSSSSKHDDKKSSSSSHRDKVKEKSSSTSDKSKDKDKSKDSKSSSHRSEKDKDRKSGSSSSSSKNKHDDKENKEKKEKKDTDDHYSVSGRGNHTRRSTDRDSNDGSSSSKGSHNPSHAKTSESKKETKTSSKSEHTSSSTDSTSPSDKEIVPGSSTEVKTATQTKPIVRVDTRLEHQMLSPPRLPFVPDVTLKKPKFAANFEEAKRMMKMRKFLEDEQKRMNQEAALLLEFQANVRPSLSQVYSSIPGPELEFACGSNSAKPVQTQSVTLDSDTTRKEEEHSESIDENSAKVKKQEAIVEEPKDSIAETLTAMDLEYNKADNSQGNIDQTIENTQSTNAESKDTILATLTNDDESKCDKTLTESDLEHNQVVVIEPKPSELQVIEKSKDTEYFEVTIIKEELSDSQDEENIGIDDEQPLLYFAEHEKYNAEIERDTFSKFYKAFQQKTENKTMYLINCGTYVENIMREVAENFGKFEIVNYHRNGHLMLPKTSKNIVKNVNIADEVILPTTKTNFESPTRYVPPIFSPTRSECSFELLSDYDAKLEEMVSKTSRQEIMEIILGGGVEESPTEMPTIDYCMESSIETEINLKRKINEVEGTENNNGNILTANKIRKLSESDQITSTTEEAEELPNNRVVTKSKYLGKARRVGLSKPKKTVLPNSPSSDKSIENYDISPACTPNGKMKTIRSKVQRYDTSDLYKPKLHFLSRRNNVT